MDNLREMSTFISKELSEACSSRGISAERGHYEELGNDRVKWIIPMLKTFDELKLEVELYAENSQYGLRVQISLHSNAHLDIASLLTEHDDPDPKHTLSKAIHMIEEM